MQVAAEASVSAVVSCVVCGTSENIKSCGRCNSISYCSKECQTAHWPDHSDVCKSSTVKVPTSSTCCVCGSVEEVKCCSRCKSAKYCSRKCQKEHWSEHEALCNTIKELDEYEKNKEYNNKTVRQNQTDHQTKLKMVRLIGEKPKIRCCLGGVETKMLVDTGSGVTMVDRRWVDENLPDAIIHPVEDFLEGSGVSLRLCAANSTEIKYDGVVVLTFGLGANNDKCVIPVLVSSERIVEPILGHNVLKDLVKEGRDEVDQLELASCIESESGQPFDIAKLVSLIEEQEKKGDFLSEVKAPGLITVPAGHRKQVKCRVKATCDDNEQSVYFAPRLSIDDEDIEVLETVTKLRRGRTNYVYVEVLNKSNDEKVLSRGSLLGSIHSVAAVVPMLSSRWKGVNHQEEKEEVVGAVDAAEADSDTKEWVPKVDLSHLDESQQEKVNKVIMENKDVFSKSDSDIGNIMDFHMKIQLNEETPVKEAYRRIPRNLYNEVREYINDLLTNGWIRESHSSYASPIVCVRKKDGGLRMCVDYRKLNGKTIADAQPIPRIQDILDGLAGKKWFSTLDMSKAYHQGYIDESSRHVTAFATPWTLYEWVRIPFGLRNAPPAFQRYMNTVLADMKTTICDPYLDDVLCHASNFDEGVEGLNKVLQRLKSKGIKLRAEKCCFLKEEVRYLGRLVSGDGYRMDPADTEALEKFKEAPKNVGELRSLLGFVGYYRCYVKDFARIVKPLYDLLKDNGKKDGKLKKESKSSKASQKASQKYDARESIAWNDDLQEIVEGLINHLKSSERIAYPDFETPFFMTTDASNYGLGAVLYQNQEGVDRVISYASRTLTDAETKYNLHSGKLEFLALKWAVTERFADYLRYGPSFTIYTDNNPLTYVLTSAKLNATGLRWVADLAEFQFTIKYRPGKLNGDADGLSRRPMELSELMRECTESVDPASVAAINASTRCLADEAPIVVCNAAVCDLTMPADESIYVGTQELIAAQMADGVIAPVRNLVEHGSKPKRGDWDKLSGESRILMRSFKKLVMVGDVLMRKTAKFQQIVLPEKFRQTIYVELHEKMAHVGPEKVMELAQQRFYWPRMGSDITNYVTRQCRCMVTKKPNLAERAPLVPIKATYPFEMVALDFLKLDKCQGGFEYVMIVVDHFTRFTQMYATRTKSSQAAAQKLWNEFIPTFGFPKQIHHDQGGEWNSLLWKELHRYTGIKATNTTPYHPMGNGMVERLNRTVINMLKAIPEKQKKMWKNHLPKLSFAYNSTVNKSTGYPPFYLMFGRNSRLPVDDMFGLGQTDAEAVKRKSHSQFVEEWKWAMEEAHRLANDNIEKAAEYNKEYYDRKVREVELKVGDQVLVRNMREKGGTGKLRSHWERAIFVIEEKKENLPVYVIKNVKVPKDTRTVHRNMLMECNSLPQEVFETEAERKERAKTKKTTKEIDGRENKEQKRKKRKVSVAKEIECQAESPESDDEREDIEVAAERILQGLGLDEQSNRSREEAEQPIEVTDDQDRRLNIDEIDESPAAEEEIHADEGRIEEEPPVIPPPEEIPPLLDIDSSPGPTRRSSRSKKPRKVFTYDEVGGPPMLAEI